MSHQPTRWNTPPHLVEACRVVTGATADPWVSAREAHRVANDVVQRYEYSGEPVVLLVQNSTDTRWFQTLSRAATALCFITRRVRFLGVDGAVHHPTQGQVAIYLGSDPDRFSEVFQNHGWIGLLERRAM